MSQQFVNGTKFAFSTILSAPVAITNISNATTAVATAASAPAEGDIIMLMSNWTDLNEQATYATNVVGSTFDLEQIDTSDENLFIPGESAGSYQVVSGFVSLSQIREVTQSGGDVNNFTWGYIDDRSMRQRSKPTDQNPLILTFTMDWDPELPWVAELEKLSKARQLVVMRERLITGDVLLYTGYVSYQKSPSRTRNENQTVTATMSINSETLRFPASFFAGS